MNTPKHVIFSFQWTSFYLLFIYQTSFNDWLVSKWAAYSVSVQYHCFSLNLLPAFIFIIPRMFTKLAMILSYLTYALFHCQQFIPTCPLSHIPGSLTPRVYFQGIHLTRLLLIFCFYFILLSFIVEQAVFRFVWIMTSLLFLLKFITENFKHIHIKSIVYRSLKRPSHDIFFKQFFTFWTVYYMFYKFWCKVLFLVTDVYIVL